MYRHLERFAKDILKGLSPRYGPPAMAPGSTCPPKMAFGLTLPPWHSFLILWPMFAHGRLELVTHKTGSRGGPANLTSNRGPGQALDFFRQSCLDNFYHPSRMACFRGSDLS
eukprot:EG_transcript_54475